MCQPYCKLQVLLAYLEVRVWRRRVAVCGGSGQAVAGCLDELRVVEGGQDGHECNTVMTVCHLQVPTRVMGQCLIGVQSRACVAK